MAQYTPNVILKFVQDVITRYRVDNKTGRIIIIMDVSQGAIASAKITEETAIPKS
jgi:hypothetical protein